MTSIITILILCLLYAFLFKKEEESPYADSKFTFEDYKQAILELSAVVMQADGHTTKAELTAFKNFWNANYGEADTAVQLQKLKVLLNQNLSYVKPCQQLTGSTDYAVRLEILRYLFIISASDYTTADELRLLQNIAHYLKISFSDFNSIRAIYKHAETGGRQYNQSDYSSGYSGYTSQSRSQSTNWAYTALEIEPTSTDEEVKKAYRRMAMKYHPDKVSVMGEAARQTATEKFKALAEAYEIIKKERGIK
ncbi:MAG: DnaJ domain-containing protein [Paludibacteraceae bacterium]|nr:DnaJ domain-containing protein [Paludibacteraceae bacterium]